MGNKIFGAIEMGGTKVNCAVAYDIENIIAEVQFPTEEPQKTLGNIKSFFSSHPQIESCGVGSFGPIDLNPNSPSYGCIQSTPKPGWTDVELLAYLQKALECDVYLDTDVNVAAIAEQRVGAAIGLSNVVYTTVGTGIGTGVVINGLPVHGLTHPEVGHIQLVRHKTDLEFKGPCPFHDSCAETLASGTAIKKRWGSSLDKLQYDHPAWSLQAWYLAQFAHFLLLSYSPQKMVFGGGVSSQILLELVKDNLFSLLNGYVKTISSRKSLDDLLVLPSLESQSGIIGALLLAIEGEQVGS